VGLRPGVVEDVYVVLAGFDEAAARSFKYYLTPHVMDVIVGWWSYLESFGRPGAQGVRTAERRCALRAASRPHRLASDNDVNAPQARRAPRGAKHHVHCNHVSRNIMLIFHRAFSDAFAALLAVAILS